MLNGRHYATVTKECHILCAIFKLTRYIAQNCSFRIQVEMIFFSRNGYKTHLGNVEKCRSRGRVVDGARLESV